jgi:hypothetical protein
MGNVLSREKREQVIALGRLGWSLRQIEQATGVRRETAGDYLRSSGIMVRSPGSWGPRSLAKPATSVITGFLASEATLAQAGQRTASSSEPYRELIERELSLGRNAMGIVARFRLSRRLDSFVVNRRRLPCSAVSQLPTGIPNRLAPFTRRIPAARSALSRLQSAAS